MVTLETVVPYLSMEDCYSMHINTVTQLVCDAQMNEKQSKKFIQDMKSFLMLCQAELGLKKMPKIIWVKDKSGVHGRTFGQFTNQDEIIRVSIRGRHPLDIMRTLAHELVHYLQHVEGRLKPGSGKTGSPEENEANSRAGIIMRHFDRAFPDAFKHPPLP